MGHVPSTEPVTVRCCPRRSWVSRPRLAQTRARIVIVSPRQTPHGWWGRGGGRFKGMPGSSLRSKKRARCPGRQNERQAKQRSNLDSGPGFRMAAPSSTAGSGGTGEGSRCVSSLSRLIGKNLPSTVGTALCGSKLEGLLLQGLSDRRSSCASRHSRTAAR